MKFFTQIPEGQAIVHGRGVYRQAPIYLRRQGLRHQAIKQFRRYLGFELKPEYAKIAGKNLHSAEMSAMDILGGVS